MNKMNKKTLYENIMRNVSKEVKKILNEAHKWEDENDDKILNVINKLYEVIEDEKGNYGLRNTYLEAEGWNGSNSDVIEWAYNADPSELFKKGIRWQDDYNIYIKIPKEIAVKYLDGENILTFDYMKQNSEEIIKKLEGNISKRIPYEKIADILEALNDAANNTSDIYIVCLGYNGSHGDVLNWLSHGVYSCLNTVKSWYNKEACCIKFSPCGGNTRMVKYLQKNLSCMNTDDDNYPYISIDDCIKHYDEIIDILN